MQSFLFSNNIMFSSYSEEIHIYDMFDFDGALNPYLHELCSLSTIYPNK